MLVTSHNSCRTIFLGARTRKELSTMVIRALANVFQDTTGDTAGRSRDTLCSMQGRSDSFRVCRSSCCSVRKNVKTVIDFSEEGDRLSEL